MTDSESDGGGGLPTANISNVVEKAEQDERERIKDLIQDKIEEIEKDKPKDAENWIPPEQDKINILQELLEELEQ